MVVCLLIYIAVKLSDIYNNRWVLIMAKKKKKVPFHIKNDYKQYSYDDGGLKITFWAKDDTDAELYRKKVDGWRK